MDGQTALQGSEVNQTQGWQYTVAAYQSAPESFARSAEAMVKVGQAYLEGRLPGPAEECFRSALKRDPAYSRAHYYLGYLYSREGRYREAILEFGKCLAAQPRNDSVYAELGLVYFKQGQVGEARALWQQGLMLANEEARLSELIHTLSYSVILDGEQRVVPNLCRMADLATATSLKQALSYLERAQLLEPFNPQVFATYARVFAAAGQPTQAMTAWEET
ncbi:MAG TPA: tetratricopeptide repeat protein, partial [Firmicutes bacterium]|nr:tetratricopeptide repeat protein [Bacillota bacterium]